MTTLPSPTDAPMVSTVLDVHTWPFAVPSHDLLTELAGDATLVFTRDGRGLLGFGRAAEAEAVGEDRIGVLRAWFGALRDTAEVDDRVGAPGTGLTAFGSFAFSRASAVSSRLVVPEIVVGHGEHGGWITWATPGRADTASGPSASPGSAAPLSAAPHTPAAQQPPTLAGAVARLAELRDASPQAATSRATSLRDGRVDPEHYLRAVGAGVDRIHSGAAQKIVLGRDVVVTMPGPVPVAAALRELAERYADCWTYSVDGLFGATPEMLVQVRDGSVRARVLAGTLDRSAGLDGGDAAARQSLLTDVKQRHEHRFAIDSLTQTLGPLVRSLDAPPEPFVLQLPNVWHLASDVRAELVQRADGAPVGALDLVEVVHPTAAVCGTPRTEAGVIIRELEGVDRGRFAGPVGWVDAAGNGEFGIALRGGVVEPDGSSVRLWAGCGIVADSDPESELAETWSKLRPMLHTLGAPESPEPPESPRP